MTVVVQRPRDLPVAALVADSDAVVVDQGASGVKQTTMAAIRTQMQGAVFAVGLSKDDAGDPTGRIKASPGHFHTVETEEFVELWAKLSGVDTTDGWFLLARAYKQST